MAIIQNTATEDGDVLIIKTNTPVIGISALVGYVDDTDNEDSSTYFSKSFRYSIDGVTYSDYIQLTIENLQAIDVSPTDTFIIEYRYRRSGESEGAIAFNSVDVEGIFDEVVDGDEFSKSIFSKYMGSQDLCSLNWSINVLEKLYANGLLPTYIERNRSGSTLEDKDFVDYWRSVTHYFAYYVCLARYYKDFHIDETLLLEYLTQRGLYICHDEEYENLLYLSKNYYDEIRQRGTINIARQKSYVLDYDESNSNSTSNSGSDSTINTKGVNGELLRLICFDVDNEFIFNLSKTEKIGWCINNASPLYRGMSNQMGANKAYEDFENFSDLTKYPLINSTYCTVTGNESKNVLLIEGVPIGSVSGIGSDTTKLINIDPRLDYEITFFVKQTDLTRDGNLTFGCFAYDIDEDIKPLLNIETGVDQDFFFEKLQLSRDDKYFFIRGIIYNKDHYEIWQDTETYVQNKIVVHSSVYYKAKRSVPVDKQPDLFTDYWLALTADEVRGSLKTFGEYGVNLKFSEPCAKILPYLVLDNEDDTGGKLYIHDFKIKPVATPYSTGFVQVNNFIHVWMLQNNLTYSTDDIEEIMRRYLLPYNCVFKNIYIE